MIPPSPVWDDILTSMIAELASITVPQGGAVGSHHYVRTVDRYLGEFDIEEALRQSALAGRLPAILVDFAGEKRITPTVGRRAAKAQATFLAICVADSVKSREDRRVLLRLLRDSQRLLGERIMPDPNSLTVPPARLAMKPLIFQRIVVVSWKAHAYAYGVEFTAEYFMNYEKLLVQRPSAPQVTPAPAGAASWGYRAIAEAADGTLSDASDQTLVINGPAVLSGAAKNLIVPSGSAEAVVYHLYRTQAPNGVPLGFIGDSPVAVFGQPGAELDDVGQAVGQALPAQPSGSSYDIMTSLQGNLTNPNNANAVIEQVGGVP